VEKLGLSIEESLRMASLYPASLIKDKKLGELSVGAAASLLIFDDAFVVKKVISA